MAILLDFDGTLVEIAPTNDTIAVPERFGERLVDLSRRLDGRLALVTGRSLEDLAGHLGQLALACAGSHGIERIRADGSRLGDVPAPIPTSIVEVLAGFTAQHPLVTIERKAFGAALHFRADPGQEEAAVAHAAEIARQHGLECKRGKCVVELVHPGADKRRAVLAFMAEAPFAGALPLFIGDDVTDEDGFRAAEELGGFGILVGGLRRGTRARFCLPDVKGVHHWLEL
ncbi:trehalose-phosphatase [Denitromonas iodatirespirans]|uniref:Trehalose 6-phosphate phosphatase n=1 Tax=Denitromonas iodatirespirans TaxID=2795389 RepID=A0A944D7W4_DENI1|nr:trehalose-phosphatase [Denitromonas iodatirespirans]MBT0959537.1 trehalose-phosphatase [Denitromonas iodatirespirans]